MIASAVVSGRIIAPPLERGTAERLFLGRAAQAALLAAAERLDPSLAAGLHDGSGPRPYAVGVFLRPGGIGEAWQVRLRFSAIEARLAARLPEILDRLPTTLRLDTIQVALEAVALDSEQDPEAGQTSYEEIIRRRMLGPDPPARRIGLRLVTPTTFHTSGRNQPLPLPGLVFGSLVDRWNAFAPLVLNPEARRYAEECLGVSQFRLQSRLVEVAGGQQVCAVGTVVYRALRPDSYWLRVLEALLDFGVHAGLGVKTAMGLGQIRRIESDGGALHRRAGGDAP
ncbi:MAG: CRISPR system precrRNA processing endoribonuclease RAMP protein Cas6 [Chloroflexi bacterium]|nr:CRISPR system precrRNA processing endoribonuclease RAMP protein Cas6 [Chloroflexota bacterium]